MTRITAADALSALRNARPEHFDSAMDLWLNLATPAQVRRNWRKAWGSLPGWARA